MVWKRPLVKPNGRFAASGNDGCRDLQLPQLTAGVDLAADRALRCFAYGDEPLRDRAVMRSATSREDGEKTAPSICACLDLRVAPLLSGLRRAPRRQRLIVVGGPSAAGQSPPMTRRSPARSRRRPSALAQRLSTSRDCGCLRAESQNFLGWRWQLNQWIIRCPISKLLRHRKCMDFEMSCVILMPRCPPNKMVPYPSRVSEQIR